MTMEEKMMFIEKQIEKLNKKIQMELEEVKMHAENLLNAANDERQVVFMAYSERICRSEKTLTEYINTRNTLEETLRLLKNN